MNTPQYLLCARVKRKLYAVAGINIGEQSCIRRAEVAFEEAGYNVKKLETCWGVVVSKQKNYVGLSKAFKLVEYKA